MVRTTAPKNGSAITHRTENVKNMNNKQHWLLDRLLIPAGILPPGIKYDDLKFNAQNREQIGNIGFEYMLLLNQESVKVNSSAVGGKIFALHAPFSEFGASLAGKFEVTKKIATKLLYGDNKITDDFYKMTELTFKFAKDVGAKNITFHIGQLDHSNLKKSLSNLASQIKNYHVQATIEYENPAIFEQIKFGKKLQTFEGSHDWLVEPEKMIQAIDSFLPKNNLKITFDTASLIACQFPITKTLTAVQERIGHVHLAGSAVGHDTAAEIDRPEIAAVVDELYKEKYNGFITAEIAGTQGLTENILATIFGASAFLNLNPFKQTCVQNAQGHITSSSKYLLNHLK